MIKNVFGQGNRNNILDPFSLVVKLYIYSYYPNNTKISIFNHQVIFQEYGYFQGTIRSLYGDSKNDITMLKFPVLYACSKYLKGYGQQANVIQLLFEKNLSALEKMETMYNGTEIANTVINDLKNIITSYIQKDDDAINTITSHNNTLNYKMKYNLYVSLDEVWTAERMNIIYCYVSDIENTEDIELKKKFVNSLLSYVECIDVLTFQKIQSFI